MIDGLWFTAVLPTEGRFTDRGGRNRPRVKKVKRVALVVLGLWSKTGRQEVPDLEIAVGEDEATVVRLLNRLHDRGVTEAQVKLIASDGAEGIMAAVETVYPTVVRQRCTGRKLDNVWDHVRPREHRAELMPAAIEGGVMRPLRPKVDHATAFRSSTGAEVALFLVLQHLGAHQRNLPWGQAAEGRLQA